MVKKAVGATPRAITINEADAVPASPETHIDANFNTGTNCNYRVVSNAHFYSPGTNLACDFPVDCLYALYCSQT